MPLSNPGMCATMWLPKSPCTEPGWQPRLTFSMSHLYCQALVKRQRLWCHSSSNEWHSIRGQPEIDMWKPLPLALSCTLTQVTFFSSDARLLENWRTKIDRPSSHPPRIPHLLWQSSADIQGETCPAECWESDRLGTLVPIIGATYKRRHWENIVSQRGPQRCSWNLRLGSFGDHSHFISGILVLWWLVAAESSKLLP